MLNCFEDWCCCFSLIRQNLLGNAFVCGFTKRLFGDYVLLWKASEKSQVDVLGVLHLCCYVLVLGSAFAAEAKKTGQLFTEELLKLAAIPRKQPDSRKDRAVRLPARRGAATPVRNRTSQEGPLG